MTEEKKQKLLILSQPQRTSLEGQEDVHRHG